MKYISAILAFLLPLFPIAASAQDEEHLFGDAFGLREFLARHGTGVESTLTSDLVSNLGGGKERQTDKLSDYNLLFNTDTEKAGWWDNGSFLLHFSGTWGDKPSEHIGDLQRVDDIEAGYTSKILQAWYQHEFFDGKFAVLGGLYDFNTEFYVLDYATTLINRSFNIGIDISQADIPTFPESALTLRVHVMPTEESYLLFAAMNGIPGDPNHPQGTHFRLGDGAFLTAEMGVLHSDKDSKTPHYKLAHGTWYRSTDFENYNGRTADNNFGYYVIGERQLLCEEDSDCSQGLGGFLQLGFAAPTRNQTGQYYGVGLSYVGLFPKREKDIFSLAYNQAANSDGFKDNNSDAVHSEEVIEATYILAVAPGLTVQPDFQYIINPGATNTYNNASVAILRLNIMM